MSELRWQPLGLDETVALLDGFPARWWIVGGYALELHLGRTLRHHEDVDVLVPRGDQLAIQRHLPGWDIRIAHGGELEPWPAERPVDLPRSSLWARRQPNGPWELQFVLAEHDGETSRYRRDPTIAMPFAEISLRSPDGVPYMRPELVLLWKSRDRRERDDANFDATLPALDQKARARLARSLAADRASLARTGVSRPAPIRPAGPFLP